MSDACDSHPAHPGASGLSKEAVADRLAVLNLVGAYAHYANVGDLKGWGGLFDPQASYRVSGPGREGPVMGMDRVLGAEEAQFASYRRIVEDPMSGEAKVYRFGMPYIRVQQAGRMDLIVDLVQYRSFPGKLVRIQLAALYDGALERKKGDWRIVRWSIGLSHMPESVSEVPADWWADDLHSGS